MVTPPLRTRRKLTIYLAGAFLLFLAFISGLSAITYHVVTDMVTTATEIDDRRAKHAAALALKGLEEGIAGLVTDNAAWTEAYEAIGKPDASAWVWDNWGYITGDNWLSDGVVIIGEHGEIRDAYWKGKPFDPIKVFGPSLRKSAALAIQKRVEPVVGFLRDGEHVTVIGVQLIRPNIIGEPIDQKNVLVLFRAMTPEFLYKTMGHYDLRDMELADQPAAGELAMPIDGMDGTRLGYLSWKSEDPGAILYEEQKPMIAAGLAVLIGFVAIALVSAWLEWRRLMASAMSSFHMATHDALTGLLNRSGFFHMLDKSRPEGGITLLLLDLDGFKAVNDNWGHPVGDALIQAVAKAISSCHADIVHVARFGGDEFAVAIGHVESLQAVTDALLACVRGPIVVDGHIVEVGVSIGLATEVEGVSLIELLRRADMALYRAKETGKGRAFAYTTELEEAKSQEARLELELRRAIRADRVYPVFQPLFDATSGNIVGVEALARWSRPTDKVAPDVFIGLAEKCGLIDVLGAHLLERSMVHARQWRGLALSVNISPLQLCSPGFAAQVENLLARTGFDPSRLTLEVTESVLISNPEQARRTISMLRGIGVRFALDDFGSGYASIGLMRQFGFDRIKIDRSLVQAAATDCNGLEVLQATVRLAHALGLPVTAEGVEDEIQARIVTEAGCDQLQGYLFARPMEAAMIDADLDLAEDDQALSVAIAS